MVIGDDHVDDKDNLKTTSATLVTAHPKLTTLIAPDQIFVCQPVFP